MKGPRKRQRAQPCCYATLVRVFWSGSKLAHAHSFNGGKASKPDSPVLPLLAGQSALSSASVTDFGLRAITLR